MRAITETCEGYLRMRALADRNIKGGWEIYRIEPKFNWVIKRA